MSHVSIKILMDGLRNGAWAIGRLASIHRPDLYISLFPYAITCTAVLLNVIVEIFNFVLIPRAKIFQII